MSNFRPLPTKCWENLLRTLGYTHIRTKGSHDQWTKKGFRTIPVWGNEKEIPAQHIKSSSATFNWTSENVYSWAKENC